MAKDNFIMLPTVDFCFKELMQNPKVRKGFISALLKIRPDELEDTILLPTLLPRDSADDKLGIMDVRALLKDGTQMNLEMQVKYFEYWVERALFYLSKMFDSQIRKGEPYEKLQKCIHVSILDFIHFPHDKECYRSIHFREDKTFHLYSDKMELQILELKKLPLDVKTGEDVVAWMKIFSSKDREEFRRMAKTNEYLDEAYHTLLDLSADEQKRLEYEAREKALKDYNSQISSAEKRGLKVGEDIGRKAGEEIGKKAGEEIGRKDGERIGKKLGEEEGEQRTRQIFKLYMQGKSIEEISHLCDVTIEKVRQILE